MSQRLLPVLMALFAIGGCETTHVGSTWEQLATVTADLNLHHAQVDLQNDGKFRMLRFEAAGAAFEMYQIQVVFANGELFEPSLRIHFEEGSWSREIDLPGKHRRILRIEFWYRASQPGGQARVVVWGHR